MAPCLQLHRFLSMHDKDRTHFFTFLLENPQEVTNFDVRSREFQFAGHRWYVYTGRPNNEHYSFYLRIVNLGKDVRVHTVYSFSIINMTNPQNNYVYHSPPEGRMFSRESDALSWGWKEFIKKETLMKPNGGFLFDGNKILVELECKSYKTIFEEVVELPPQMPDIEFPMLHTSPFSVGGFAWQVRVFPNGPDEENKGNVALFLHCTTSTHLAKVKAKFLIEEQPSPSVYEHTFPPNCISEMPSGVAFPFKSVSATDKLKVGIEFLSVLEVNEIQVTLSNSTNEPTVCVTPFEDLTGCPWVLKTLQATTVKLKMDQNDKTTSGLQEFYHRHILWNATLIAPGSDDVTLNIPLNTKGPLLAYFGENWSDADVIKTELLMEDLTFSDNPYRTDVDDGYERYSYITVHVELFSNHILYKTPAPSPTADRERKTIYSARKEKALMHQRYQEMVLQKNELDNQVANLRNEINQSGEKNLAEYSRFVFDLLASLAEKQMNQGKLKRIDPSKGRNYTPPENLPDDQKEVIFLRYRHDFRLLVNDARPETGDLAKAQREVDVLQTTLRRFIEEKLSMRVTRIIKSGSIGMDTVCKDRMDVDLVLLSADLPRNGHEAWLPAFIAALVKLITEATAMKQISGITNIKHSNYSLQFLYEDTVDVDLFVSYDWALEGTFGYDALYDEMLRQKRAESLSWFAPSVAERQMLFIAEQPDQVHDLIKVVKQWRNNVDWKADKNRPPSYLLSLLIVKAYENACRVVDGTLPSNRTVLKFFIKLVLSSRDKSRNGHVKLSWDKFYDSSDYNIEYIGNQDAPEMPLIQDPASPVLNVADRPTSWLTFQKEAETWAICLGLMDEGTLLPITSPRTNAK